MMFTNNRRNTIAISPRYIYLNVVGEGIDELKTGNPLVTAQHSYVFCMLAVGHPNSIRRTLCQCFLLAIAVHIVEPDAP